MQDWSIFIGYVQEAVQFPVRETMIDGAFIMWTTVRNRNFVMRSMHMVV